MPNMMVNGFKDKMLDRVKESKFGLMAQCTKDGGKKIKLMAKED